MKKVGIIGFTNSFEFSNFELIKHMLFKLSNSYNIIVFTKKDNISDAYNLKQFKNTEVKFLPFSGKLFKLYSFIYGVIYSDVLLVLNGTNAFLYPFVQMFTKTKLIVTIDFLVQSKKRNSNFIVKFYHNLKEKCVVKYAHQIVCSNDFIQDYIAKKYGVVARVIERGGDHTESIDSSRIDHERFPFLKTRYALSYCNHFSKRAIYKVLKMFSNTERFNLVLIGNWNETKFVRKLKIEFANSKNIWLLDSNLSNYTNNLITSNALCYIHLNTGLNSEHLIDAMGQCLPILSYNNEINVNITEGKASYFVDEDDVKLFLETSSIEQLKKNSILMKEIANRRFKWSEIVKEYDALLADAFEKEIEILSLKKKYLSNHGHLLLDFNAGHLKYQYLFYEKD